MKGNWTKYAKNILSLTTTGESMITSVERHTHGKLG